LALQYLDKGRISFPESALKKYFWEAILFDVILLAIVFVSKISGSLTKGKWSIHLLS